MNKLICPCGFDTVDHMDMVKETRRSLVRSSWFSLTKTPVNRLEALALNLVPELTPAEHTDSASILIKLLCLTLLGKINFALIDCSGGFPPPPPPPVPPQGETYRHSLNKTIYSFYMSSLLIIQVVSNMYNLHQSRRLKMFNVVWSYWGVTCFLHRAQRSLATAVVMSFACTLHSLWYKR